MPGAFPCSSDDTVEMDDRNDLEEEGDEINEKDMETVINNERERKF